MWLSHQQDHQITHKTVFQMRWENVEEKDERLNYDIM